MIYLLYFVLLKSAVYFVLSYNFNLIICSTGTSLW